MNSSFSCWQVSLSAEATPYDWLFSCLSFSLSFSHILTHTLSSSVFLHMDDCSMYISYCWSQQKTQQIQYHTNGEKVKTTEMCAFDTFALNIYNSNDQPTNDGQKRKKTAFKKRCSLNNNANNNNNSTHNKEKSHFLYT